LITEKKIGGPIELAAILLAICIVFAILWIYWYIPTQKKAVLVTYKSSVKITQSNVAMCDMSGDLPKSGGSGSLICRSSSGSYPIISSDCGSDPYFHIKTSSPSGWRLDTYTDSKLSSFWDCNGCRMSCTISGCEEIGSCE